MTHEGAAQAAPRDRAAAPAGPPAGGTLMAGFPPALEARVTLANWQDPPFSRWAFRHMRELIPSQLIPAGAAALSRGAAWAAPS